MHILHIYKDYPPVMGGVEHHLRDLSEGLAARGHRVTALTTSQTRRTTVEAPLAGLEVIRAARDLHLASTPLSLAMLGRARGIRADIVHLHFPYPPGDLAALLAPGGPPLVVTYHSDIVRQRALLRLYRPLLGHTLRRAARIIATSPGYVRSSPFLRAHAAKCAVVPLGVDAARFHPGAERPAGQPPVVLFVGRLRYYKGLHFLLDALPHVLPATLVIAGAGPERARLEAQAAALGVAGRVRFIGDVAVDDLPALYRAADVFVLPAHLRAEAFGIAQLEALASGLPCVSTELGTGTSYANRHGETGLVVQPGDAAALARAINILLASPELRRHYGANGRRRVERLFTSERMLDGVEAVYRDALGRGA